MKTIFRGMKVLNMANSYISSLPDENQKVRVNTNNKGHHTTQVIDLSKLEL